MTDLSPAAQDVLDAASDVYWDWSDMSPASPSTIAAAALRAAADQVVPETTTPWNSTVTLIMSTSEVRAKLLAIAAELQVQ